MSRDGSPWPPGAATSLGSWPGTDVDEAARVVVGETPQLVALPELPARGIGADLIGRSAVLLAELHVDRQPSGWRVVSGAGLDEAHARGHLHRDLDALEIAALGHQGVVKVQAVGPLTLAAHLQSDRGHPLVADHGARRDLAQSLAAGLVEHLHDVRRRLPRAQLLLQLDEPSAAAVLAGRVPTISGFGTHRAVHAPEAVSLLGEVIRAVAEDGTDVLVHDCGDDAPLERYRQAGARALTVPAAGLSGRRMERVAALVEDGTALVLGVVAADRPDAGLPSVREGVDAVRRPWREIGFDLSAMAAVAVSPTCGLAGWSPGPARRALTRVHEIGAAVVEAAAGAE